MGLQTDMGDHLLGALGVPVLVKRMHNPDRDPRPTKALYEVRFCKYAGLCLVVLSRSEDTASLGCSRRIAGLLVAGGVNDTAWTPRVSRTGCSDEVGKWDSAVRSSAQTYGYLGDQQSGPVSLASEANAVTGARSEC